MLWYFIMTGVWLRALAEWSQKTMILTTDHKC